MKWEEARAAIMKDRTKGARVVCWDSDYFCVHPVSGEILYYQAFCKVYESRPSSRPNDMWLDSEWVLIDRIDAERPRDWNIYKDPDLTVDLWPKYPRKIMVRRD